MRCRFLVALLLAWPVLPAGRLLAQPVPAAPRGDAALGLRVAPVPEALYAHVPDLPSGQGLLVEAIQPGSRAADLGLKRFDILLSVGTAPVKSGVELQDRLGTLAPGEREVVQIIRGGKQFALTVANPVAAAGAEAAYTPPRSLFKPGGPPAVSVEVKPLPAGGMEVNLFYLNRLNKMERHALSGSLDDIERRVAELAEHGQMPDNIHDLVAVALRRLRSKSTPPSPK